MKRLINNGDIFDKYVSFEDKKFRDDTIKQFNWLGHRHIAGTYSGAAYTTSLGENYMANSLRNDSNPKGSLLVAAKNYTDQKIATIVGGSGGGGSTAPARHGYSIFVSGDKDFHYEVYTTKDYGWQIGKYNNITDFKSNDNYKELRYEGSYPASGINYRSDASKKQIITRFDIIGSSLYVSGYDIVKGIYSTDGIPDSSLNAVSIIKLY